MKIEYKVVQDSEEEDISFYTEANYIGDLYTTINRSKKKQFYDHDLHIVQNGIGLSNSTSEELIKKLRVLEHNTTNFIKARDLCLKAFKDNNIVVTKLTYECSKELIHELKLYDRLGKKKFKQYMYLKDI